MIMGWIEYDDKGVSETSLQMITFARQAAARIQGGLTALFLGSAPADVDAELGRHGVERIVRIEHEYLDTYAPRAWAASMAQYLGNAAPQMVLAAGTSRGNEVMAHLAAILDLPLAANCSALSPGESFGVTRLRWGGSLLEQAELDGKPKLLTVALNTAAAQPVSPTAEPVLDGFTPTLTQKDLQVRLTRRQAEVADGVTLKTAPVVVGGGRGVGSSEGYARLEELAKILGGAVGCSRVATNNGWRPHSDQVGLTGTRISPELYMACGISGAIQHLVGCKGAKRIMVINNDPEAAFFAKADYGVLGDLHEVIPAIIEELKKHE